MFRKISVSLVIIILVAFNPLSVMYSTGNVYNKIDKSSESIDEIIDENITDISLDSREDEYQDKVFSDDKFSFKYHQINDDEIDRIKRAFSHGSEEGKELSESNVIWNKKNKGDLIRSTKVVNDVNFINQDMLESRDLSKTPYFPEIKGQGLQGSCAAWAITYYSYGFLEAKDNGWTGASQGNPKHLMSPSWTFNKIHCVGSGSSIRENAEIINNWGVSTWSNLTYNQNDDVSWGNESAFRDAVKHRGKEFYYLEYNESSTIDDLKGLINSEIPVTFSIDSSQFSDAFSDGNAIISSKEYERTYPDHSNTIVGYNDTISDDGETGAFKVANSYGKSFGDDGFYWITYDMLNEMGILSNLQYITDRVDYEPSLIGTFEFDERPTRTGNISLSIIADRGAKRSKQFKYEFDPNFEHTLPSFMCFDISEFSDWWDRGKRADTFELDIGSHFGEITSFKMEYYEEKYRVDDPDYISKESKDVPSPTPSQVKVNFYGPSNIITTEPKFKSDQVPYAQTVSVTFTESMDTDTIPELEQIEGKDPGGWNFEGWASVNTENDTATWSHNPWNVMENITLRISGYVNESGYMGEPYEWYFKTSTYDPINIGSHSDFVEYANDFGWQGDGSEEDPWVIENIEIDGDNNHSCIFISGSDDHFIIRNSTFHNSIVGLHFQSTANGVIENNTIRDVGNAIDISDSENMKFSDNDVEVIGKIDKENEDIWIGISISNTHKSEFASNDLTSFASNDLTSIRNNLYGVQIKSSSNIKLEDNTISDFEYGFIITDSNDSIIKDNKINTNKYGAELTDSKHMEFKNNTFSGKGILMGGNSIEKLDTHLIESNILNGKPILYYKNRSNLDLGDNIGQLILVNCSDLLIEGKHFDQDPSLLVYMSSNISVINCKIESKIYSPFGLRFSSSENITIKGCEFGKSSLNLYKTNRSNIMNNVFKEVSKDSLNHTSWVFGMHILFSERNLIKDNYITGREIGISIYEISKCKMIQNTISYTTSWGIGNKYAEDNIFYHNNFYENKIPAAVYPCGIENIWDDGYPSGGNYWSQFGGVDKNGDGIADSSYTVSVLGDENVDRYPLMNPFKPWDEVNLPKEILSVQPTPNSYNVSLDEDIKIVFNGTLDTSDIPSIELIGENGSSNLEFQGFSSTNIANDTVTWTHDIPWEKGEKKIVRISSYSFIGINSNDSYKFSFTTYEEQLPNITDLSSETIKNGQKYTFLAEIDDNAVVEDAEIVLWFDGNKTTMPLYNVYENKYKMKVKVPFNATEIRYYMKAKDTSGNIAVTEEKNYTVIDDLPPVIKIKDPVIKIKDIDKIQVFENTTFDASDSYDNRGIKDFFWEIDGKKFNQSIANVTFYELGRIKVTLSVVDYSGNWNSVLRVYTVNDYIKPVARGGGNRTVPINEEVKLDASNSTDNYGISEYIWKFDNRTFLGRTINYTFTNFETFIINLTVKDIAGNTDTVNLTYTVKDLEPPVADAGDDLTAIVGQTVTLDGSQSTDNFYIKDYLWEIQGNVYKGEKFDYTFEEPGVYQVTLRVVDLSQNSDTDSIEVTIKPGEVTVGPIEDKDGNKLKGVKVELIHEGDSIGTNKTDKNGIVKFKLDFDPDKEEFKIKLKDERFDGTKEKSFEGNVSGEISVETESDYLLSIVIVSMATVVLIILWIYRKKFNGF